MQLYVTWRLLERRPVRVPQDVRDKYPAVEWKKISDFRNVLIHEYFEIDYEIMWEVLPCLPAGRLTQKEDLD